MKNYTNTYLHILDIAEAYQLYCIMVPSNTSMLTTLVFDKFWYTTFNFNNFRIVDTKIISKVLDSVLKDILIYLSNNDIPVVYSECNPTDITITLKLEVPDILEEEETWTH